MLVLSRKKNEVIFIGPPGPGKIRLVVVEIRGDKVRLGIDAPAGVPVWRGELLRGEFPPTRPLKTEA